MEFLIRFSQSHETFRLAEIKALAALEKIDLDIVFYNLDVSFGLVDDIFSSGQHSLDPHHLSLNG